MQNKPVASAASREHKTPHSIEIRGFNNLFMAAP